MEVDGEASTAVLRGPFGRPAMDLATWSPASMEATKYKQRRTTSIGHSLDLSAPGALRSRGGDRSSRRPMRCEVLRRERTRGLGPRADGLWPLTDASANYAAWDPFLLLRDVRTTEFSSAH